MSKKIQYIPQYVAGKISNSECAELIGIKRQSVCRLGRRYAEYGDAVFVHGNTGRTPKNKKYDKSIILDFYHKSFEGSPFAVASEYCPCSPSYSTVYKTLSGAGVVSPKSHIPVREKKKHLPRKERPCEGELVQLDASLHEWFIGKNKTTIHGGIDDATHKITALYMCENECLLGYNEILRQTCERFGGYSNVKLKPPSGFALMEKSPSDIMIMLTTKSNGSLSSMMSQITLVAEPSGCRKSTVASSTPLFIPLPVFMLPCVSLIFK